MSAQSKAMTIPDSTGHADVGRASIVVGAGRGLGRAIATALAADGSRVVAVSRTPADGIGGVAGHGHAEIADAADPTAAATLLDRWDPDLVVLVAGATPDMRPLHEHTWQSFSAHWDSEVQISFRWVVEALRRPLRPGSKVIVISSGAALAGSPLSGGYAGAKATQRFIAGYAQDEARRGGLDLTFTTIMPQFAPQTAVGAAGVAAYAAQAGLSVPDYLEQLPFPLLTPEVAGTAVVDLAHGDPDTLVPAYLLNGAGLHPVAS